MPEPSRLDAERVKNAVDSYLKRRAIREYILRLEGRQHIETARANRYDSY